MYTKFLFGLLAACAIALPMKKRTTITGVSNGSIFSFSSAATAREEFYTEGSCGLSTYFPNKVPSNVPLVAMPESVMSQYGSAQNNVLCGQIITLTRESTGVTYQAAIADTCPANTMDMTIDLWVDFGQSATDGTQFTGLSWSVSTDSVSTGACKETYTVVSGDYCYKIWVEYGITEAELYAWNPSLDSACDLAIGQVLCVSE